MRTWRRIAFGWWRGSEKTRRERWFTLSKQLQWIEARLLGSYDFRLTP